MDDDRFDALAVWLGRSTSRRRLATLIGVTAPMWPLRHLAAAAARCDDGRPKCGALCCPSGTECVGNVCVPTSVDLCVASDAPCTGDPDCDVAVGESCCGGRCVNTTCAADHCATCDTTCAADRRCTDGVCLPSGACPAGMSLCGAGCCTSVERCGKTGACEAPPGLDFLGVSVVCAPLVGGSAGLQCSLQRVYGQDWPLACGTDIGMEVVKPILAAAKAPRVIKRIEELAVHVPDAIDLIDAATAETRLKQVTGVLGLVLPVDCITGLADLLSGGQYTALELCLADQRCTDLLGSEFGP